MTALIATARVRPKAGTSAMAGQIRVDWPRALWLLCHLLAGISGVIWFVSWQAALLFVALTAVTICAGHSVGMHRLLIHQSFQTSPLLRNLLVWLGVLVGMAGPFGMIRAHDMRDWHQQQQHCPLHPSHGAGFWRDAWWQLCCVFDLRAPPDFIIEPQLADDPVLRLLERTWMLQQLPLALLLFACGGWGFVLWGVSLRIAVSLIGHWMVGHFAHKAGHQGWRVAGLPVQGYNLPGLGLLTFGENWHGNHHAFPASAKLGVEPGQFDPGYWLICGLARLRLAWGVQLPADLPPRAGLQRLAQQKGQARRPALNGVKPTPEDGF